MPRCKNCKDKFTPKYFNQKYCIKDECISVFIKETKEQKQKQHQKEWNKRKKELKESLKTHKDYLKEVQIVFNKFIRLRDKNKPCISCGRAFGVDEKYDAGHFYSVGSSPSIRFNELNVHAQCVHCNQHKHGNIHEYTIRLPKRIGLENFEKLQILKNKSNKYTIEELKEIKNIYKEKTKKIS